MFRDSGHKLIKSGKYYRCSDDTNQKCGLGEKQILAETLERNYSRLANKLHSKELDFDSLLESLLRDHFWDLVFGIDKRAKNKQEIIDATLSAMQSDVNENKIVDREDEKDYRDNFMEVLRADHPVMLFGYAVSMIQALTTERPESDMGRLLAHFSRRIYLGKTGKVESIELERWAWYVLNVVIARNTKTYFQERSELNFINGNDLLHEKGIAEASLSFGTEDFPDAMGENFVAVIGWIKQLKDTFSMLLNNDPEKVNKLLPTLLDRVQNDPAFGVMMRMNSTINFKQK